jgi:glycosyltransferase involved in cell wall biosynthesis
MAMSGPRVAFLAWSSISGRSEEIADALGGEARCFFDLKIVRRALVPARYGLSSIRTAVYLAVRRPRAIIVTNPPVFPALLAYPYARLRRAPLLLDSHPDAFRSDGPHSRFLRVHAWLARRALGVLVTTEDLVRRVEAWGGVGIVVHEPPPVRRIGTTPPSISGRPRVLVLGSFSSDEPVAEVLAAAGELPEVDFELTGDTRRCPPGIVESATENVNFCGFLNARDYAQAIDRASIVVVLTRWLEWAVPRSAYDAVYGERPLVLTDSPMLRELFPYAVPVRNEPSSIAAGVRDALARFDELAGLVAAARTLQTNRWNHQLARLESVLSRDDRSSVSA